MIPRSGGGCRNVNPSWAYQVFAEHGLLHDYNLMAGSVWMLVLVTLLFAPMVLGRLRQ
jgi:hypothetical protein